jgi:iron complex outermembrane receptor protein
MFDNQSYVVRAEFEQQRKERFHGKFGLWGKYRDYAATGEEALSPPTTQTALAGFVYEELHAGDSVRFQLGARVEHNDYDPEPREEGEHHEEGEHDDHDGELEPPPAIPRSFTGFSGSAGVHVSLPMGHALVANFTHSYRAPALEELYNFGPHVGNLAFEIGNPDLERELSNGVDVSFRHRSSRARGDINFFYYGISDFVFASLTGEFIDNLQVAEFLQGDSRFVGFDAEVEFELHQRLWLNLGLGYVNAKLTETDEYLPRIPPFQGRVRFEIPYKGLSVVPELVFASQQDKVFRDETPTDGYTVANLMATYTMVRGHYAHVFSARFYNMGDVLYRNHTSFIKDYAAEMGRGVKFSYALRFF